MFVKKKEQTSNPTANTARGRLRATARPDSFHSTRPGPLRAAALLLIALLLQSAQSASSSAQSGRDGANPKYAEQPGVGASGFSGKRAFEHVKHLVEIGPHPAGSKAIEKARRYILGHLAGETSQDEWTADTPAGKVRMVNIEAELKGESDDTIIIASHYDTKPFKDFNFVGANDSGSSDRKSVV